MELQRIIQESVPGKQITLAHVISSPAMDIYERIGVENLDSIGILNLTPAETAIIAADIAAKAAPVSIGFLDRFTGAVLLQGDVQSVTYALEEVCRTFREMLGFTVTEVTRT